MISQHDKENVRQHFTLLKLVIEQAEKRFILGELSDALSSMEHAVTDSKSIYQEIKRLHREGSRLNGTVSRKRTAKKAVKKTTAKRTAKASRGKTARKKTAHRKIHKRLSR